MKLVRIVFVLALVVSGCSNEPTADDLAKSLAAAQPELGTSGVECIIAELGTDYTDAQLAELVSTDSSSTPSEQETFATRQFEAVRACDLEGQVNPALVQSFATANTLSSDVAECAVAALQEQFGFWELTDQLAEDPGTTRFQRRQLEAIFTCGDRTEVARQLEPQLAAQGVASADAECVAETLAASMNVTDLTVLYSGDTTDRFFELYFDAVQDCDALPEGG